ncbi:hypothetical protein [Legionella jordanis]|uniref:Coiled-coil protein n=1 Tax=Legionella jordanis TaxID=456 RepID=A0A0W0VET2_9GAMM|nr:hypothetical protein [Legionella jordanis]KTD18153.1 coiled-coil protein [Legionella jordanis]RMX00537.1 hypothetical protein EAW55_12295 [Legionella jordanis]RMX21346.1 hypothetical protein EAS68_04030 [Legionella jordanis]VEH13754.1 coiled-coil protein [Legionella jordanis]HAT8714137.1 hypothetical protein [Legionella jordanis]
MNIGELLKTLESRLPELEWKMAKLGQHVSPNVLPKGLFRLSSEAGPGAFILEIKVDLQQLANHQHEYSGYYIAQKIQRKIDVLVSLCRLQKNQPKQQTSVSLQMIASRQQHLQRLQAEIDNLTNQHEAIKTQLQLKHCPDMLLNLKAELGEIEKGLSLAREAMVKVSRW